jgi:hypothetical protein
MDLRERNELYHMKQQMKVGVHNIQQKGPHFAVLVFSNESVTIPGDERSRTSPGHGYPEHTQTYETVEYYATINQSEWEDFVGLLYKEEPKRTDVVAMHVDRVATVKTSVSLL